MSLSTGKHRDALPIEESIRRAERNKRAYYEKNKPEILEKLRLLRAARSADHQAKDAFHRYQRSRQLVTRYGITVEDYEEMLTKQGGLCAVCCAEKPGNGRGDRYFDVDHDHSTGRVRGLLCRKCNTTTGVLEKNRALISKIEAYLKGHK